ncbi:AAA family ATPase [Leifsonia sp. Le1]|uniref:AAA family ATPase n=1 Tax=Leifsonia sp. Le1 TaxID=3404918 RepID=UPI003EC074BC
MTNSWSQGTPYVVLVLGRPASGKSTISAKIAEQFSLPNVSKDMLKEILFDTLGGGDVAWSVKLGRTSFALLDHVIELQLQAGGPFLIDAAYSAQYENAKFQRWQEIYGFEAVQILCTASPEEIGRRFIQRVNDGTRHPGHADAERVDEFRAVRDDGRYGQLELRGTVLHYKTDQVGSEQKLLASLTATLPPQ